jgi:glyoxylase I family protein
MSTPLQGLRGIDHVALTVPDLAAAVEFYRDVLGAEELYAMGPFDARDLPAVPDGRDWADAHVNVPDARLSYRMLRWGKVKLELFEYERPNGSSTPPRNSDLGGHHIALEVDDIENAAAALEARGVHVLAGPIVLEGAPAESPLKVHYFLDPWGNQLELVAYSQANGTGG